MLPGCHDNDEEEQSKEPNVPTLIISDTSQEYTDSTGIDLHQFIITTLNSNPRYKKLCVCVCNCLASNDVMVII